MRMVKAAQLSVALGWFGGGLTGCDGPLFPSNAEDYSEYAGISMDEYVERVAPAVCVRIAECEDPQYDVDFCLESYGAAQKDMVEAEQCLYWPQAAESCVVNLELRLDAPCGQSPYLTGACGVVCRADLQ